VTAAFGLTLSLLLVCRGSTAAMAIATAWCVVWSFVRVKSRAFYAVIGILSAVAAALTAGRFAVIVLFAGTMMAVKNTKAPLLSADITAVLLIICAVVQVFWIGKSPLEMHFDTCATALAVLAPIPIGRLISRGKCGTIGIISAAAVSVLFAIGNAEVNCYATLFVLPLVISAALNAYKSIG